MRIASAQSGRHRKRSLWAAACVAVAALVLFVSADLAVRPAVESVVAYQTRIFAARLVNDAMLEQIAEMDAQYGDFVRLTRGQDGGATSLEADMAEINRLKYNVSMLVIEELQKRENQEIHLPLGTIIGNAFTSGRGPLVPVKVLPAGYVQTDVYNSFTSAGINQTLHRIMLRVNVQMTAVLPGYSVDTETETNFSIAETVIIGDIPQGYAVIDGAKATLAPIENRE